MLEPAIANEGASRNTYALDTMHYALCIAVLPFHLFRSDLEWRRAAPGWMRPFDIDGTSLRSILVLLPASYHRSTVRVAHHDGRCDRKLRRRTAPDQKQCDHGCQNAEPHSYASVEQRAGTKTSTPTLASRGSTDHRITVRRDQTSRSLRARLTASATL